MCMTLIHESNPWIIKVYARTHGSQRQHAPFLAGKSQDLKETPNFDYFKKD